MAAARSLADTVATGIPAARVSAGAATTNQRLRPEERSSVTLVRLAMVTS